MTRAKAGVVHEIVGGSCRVCGEVEEWLAERGSAIVLLDGDVTEGSD